jgi:hypothetical protein
MRSKELNQRPRQGKAVAINGAATDKYVRADSTLFRAPTPQVDIFFTQGGFVPA